MRKGFFIVVEGADGAGTTTISKHLADMFSVVAGKEQVVLTHEPSDYEIGKFIRKILKKEINVESGLAMLHLFLADRVEHVNRTIIPAINDGKIVISDRYYPSMFVYQSVKNNCLEKSLERMKWFLNNDIVIDGITEPDIILYLRCTEDVSKDRRKTRGDEEEKYENDEFQRVVIKLYDLFFNFSGLGFRYKKVDANQELKEVKRESFLGALSIFSRIGSF